MVLKGYERSVCPQDMEKIKFFDRTLVKNTLVFARSLEKYCAFVRALVKKYCVFVRVLVKNIEFLSVHR
jgi:hypothetical protein